MTIGDNINRLRRRRGLSLDVVASFAGHTKSWLSKLERGSISVELVEELRAIARGLGVPLLALLDGGDEIRRSTTACPPADWGIDLPWNVEGSLSALRTITQEGDLMIDELGRRGFMALTGLALTAPAHQWLASLGEDPEDVVSTHGARVTDSTVQKLEVMNAHLRTLDEQLDRPTVYRTVHQQVSLVQRLLSDHAYTNTVGRRLYAIEAELLRLCGRLTYESGQYPVAQRHWIVALRAARTAGDDAQGANILAFMSDQEYDQGHLGDAVKLAEAARAGYRGDSPEVVARLAIQEALAHAAIGSGRECQRALGVAYDQIPEFGSGQSPAWSHWVDTAMVTQFAASCSAHLGDWATAEQRYEQAACVSDSWSSSAPNELGRIRIKTAQASLHRADADRERVLALGHEGMDLFESTGGTPPLPVIASVRDLTADLNRRWRSPEVTELVHRARVLAHRAA